MEPTLYTGIVRVELYRSATVGIFSEDQTTSVLCDPWLTEGAFLGSWFHDPPLLGFEFDEVLRTKWTFVYISHLHADHFDRKFLSKIAKLQPECRVLIPKHGKPWLKRAILNLGFSSERIIEVNPEAPIIHGDMRIQILPADYCNPLVCGAQTPCYSGFDWQRSIDSLAVFSCDGQTIVNANDVMATDSVPKVLRDIGDCDLLMADYGGAGPYPQCFPDVADKESVARNLANRFIDVVAQAAHSLKARSVMPYAGQYYLGGSKVNLNASRAILNLDETKMRLQSAGIDNVLTPDVFSGFEVSELVLEREHRELSKKEVDTYLSRLSKAKYPYEDKEIEWSSYQADLLNAAKSLQERYLAIQGVRRTNGYSASFVIRSQLGRAVFDFKQDILDFNFDVPATFDDCTTIDIDARLLEMLVCRKKNYKGFTQAHWNQAEIGSHFLWRREGKYIPELHYFFNFLQTN